MGVGTISIQIDLGPSRAIPLPRVCHPAERTVKSLAAHEDDVARHGVVCGCRILTRRRGTSLHNGPRTSIPYPCVVEQIEVIGAAVHDHLLAIGVIGHDV